ncbi:hypothetical protein ACL02T_10330 [Pseudonocardia sp. RS010]|uniref:hypothetical protein n=1 Tax=Pseudonocardia sp. RS010 TaxID=3385979 RepID=UPI0039A38E2F
MVTNPESPGSREPPRTGNFGRRSLITWWALSAIFLLAMGGIHLYLVLFGGTGGVLGRLFVVNAIGALVLAVTMVLAQGRLLVLASLLSLLFMAGTLLALVLALTVGLFGIRSSLNYQLAPTTLVVESIGTVVLVTTTARAAHNQRAAPTQR